MAGAWWAAWIVVGAITWTFAEYALHRWEGHRKRHKHAGTRLHILHHAAPASFSARSTVVLWFVSVVGPLCLVSWWLGGLVATGFFVGFSAGYIVYEMVHRGIHMQAPRSAYGRFVRRHHFGHHFTDPKGNHGVVTDVWDRVFGTLLPPHRIRVPPKHLPAWMGAKGAIHPEYADTYELRPVKRRS